MSIHIQALRKGDGPVWSPACPWLWVAVMSIAPQVPERVLSNLGEARQKVLEACRQCRARASYIRRHAGAV